MIKRKIYTSMSLLVVGMLIFLAGTQPRQAMALSSDAYQVTDALTIIPTNPPVETNTPTPLPAVTETPTTIPTQETATSAPTEAFTATPTALQVTATSSAAPLPAQPDQGTVLYAGTFDDSHPSIKYTAGWISEANKSTLNGAHKWTNAATEQVSFTFYGGKFHLLFTRMRTSGSFQISIDGKKYTINSAQSNTQYRARWLSPSMLVGHHSVVIQKQFDDKKPIYIDGFIIYGPISSPANPPTATTIPPTATLPPTSTVLPTLMYTSTAILPTITATASIPTLSFTATANPTVTPTLVTPTNSPTATLPASPTLPPAQPGTTYYVSPNGNDASAGNQAEPWRTIQKAANTVLQGDTVIVLDGTYSERVIINRSGAAGAPITFQAQGSVISQGFTITSNYVVIRGFEITNTPDSSRDGWGIWVNGGNCLIENNYIHDATRGGIVLFILPGKETVMHDCVVRNNRLYRNAFAGMEVHGRNNLIESNEIWGTIQYHPKWANPPNWVDADGMRFHGSGHLIRRNYIHDINYGVAENSGSPHIDCFQTFADGSYHEAASNVVFEQNTCVNMQAQTAQAVGKAFMIEDANGLILRNNILRAYRVLQAVDSANLQIVNNVFTNRLDLPTAYFPSMITLNNTPNSLIKNNSFFDPLSHVIYFENSIAQQGINISNNNAYRSDGKNAQGISYPGDLWNVNPLFVNPAGGDFHLQAGSPLINMGTAVSIVASDFDGRPRPQGSNYDIGAYEWMP